MALKLAIDREAMVNQLLQGYGTVGNDFPINAVLPVLPGGHRAARLRSGGGEGHLRRSPAIPARSVLQTSEVAFPGAVDAAVLYQQQAAKAGIEIEVKREPGDGYWDQVWNVQPFCASYWGGRPTQDGMYSTAYYSKADWNDTRFMQRGLRQAAARRRAASSTRRSARSSITTWR